MRTTIVPPVFFLSLNLSASAFPLLSLRSLFRRATMSSAGNTVASLLPSDSSDMTPINLSTDFVNSLSLPQVAALAAASYCDSVRAGEWTCPTCADVPDMQLLWEGGDGASVQKTYVGYSPSLGVSGGSVVVVHEGTEMNIEAWFNNIDLPLVSLDSSLDDGSASSDISVHQGFQSDWLDTKDDILSAVQSAISAHSPGQVLVIGHSLGSALAFLDAVHLRINLDSSVPLQMVGLGQPRMGNDAWVTYVDGILGANAVRITNYNDLVARVPPQALGYEQTAYELWVSGNNSTGTLPDTELLLCPGVENEDCALSIPTLGISLNNFADWPHAGPWFGTMMNYTCA